MGHAASAKKRVCQICGKDARYDLHPGILVSPAVAEFIQKEAGKWCEEGWICAEDHRKFRHEYVKSLLETEGGKLSELDKEVLDSMKSQELLTKNPEEELATTYTFGQKLADKIAAVGGSWGFIIGFSVVLCSWIIINTIILSFHPFDPYPFILMNLILSCLAAIQAPIIMMSQNRQETRDRLTAKNDYQINLKAEIEIRHLHQKLDHVLTHQWERLIEIQELQLEMNKKILDEKKGQ